MLRVVLFRWVSAFLSGTAENRNRGLGDRVSIYCWRQRLCAFRFCSLFAWENYDYAGCWHSKYIPLLVSSHANFWQDLAKFLKCTVAGGWGWLPYRSRDLPSTPSCCRDRGFGSWNPHRWCWCSSPGLAWSNGLHEVVPRFKSCLLYTSDAADE